MTILKKKLWNSIDIDDNKLKWNDRKVIFFKRRKIDDTIDKNDC